MNQPIITEGDCEGESIEFYAGRYLDAQYSWDFDGDGLFELQDLDTFAAVYEYLNPGLYAVQLSITSPNCPGGVIQTLEKSVQVAPTAQFKMEQACMQVGLKSFSGSVETTEWLISDGSQYFTNEINHTFKGKSGKYEVLLVAHVGGCSDTSVKVFEYADVKADPKFDLSSHCVPSKVQFTNADPDAENYRWYINDSLISNQAIAHHELNTPGNYQLSVSVSNRFGCYDSVDLTKPLFVGPSVIAQVEVENSQVCMGSDVVVNDVSINNTNRTLNWGDGSSDSKGRVLKHTYEAPGSYTLELVVENSKFGCVDTLTYDQEVVIAPLPEANFLIEKKGDCVPQEVYFTNTSKNDYSKSTFLFNGYDTLNMSDTLKISKAGKNDFRLILENEIAGCTSEKMVSLEFFKPLTEDIAPSIFETQADSTELRVNWSSVPNAKYFQLFTVKNKTLEALAVTNDTFYNFQIIDSSRSSGFAIKAIDQCAFSSGVSATVRGIDLEGSFQADSFPTLQWSPFNAWAEELDYYEVEINIGQGWEYAGRSRQPHYIDRSFDKNETLEAEYRIVAHHKNGLFKSQSDEWSFEFEPNIFIPTAFTPNYDNINDHYEIKGYGMEKLNVQIFNSFGERVFDYEGQNVAWDGSFKGELVQAGTYICIVEAHTPTGNEYNFQRTISVLR